MTVIKIESGTTKQAVQQIQKCIGGDLTERWGEHTLTINNTIATGKIKFITFDWGVNLLEYEIQFHEEVLIEMTVSKFNPLQFFYCLEGYCAHTFNSLTNATPRRIEQFQSVIITDRKDGQSSILFPKNLKLVINVIQIERVLYLKKRINGVAALNTNLNTVFTDLEQEDRFAYFGSYNLKLASKIAALRKVSSKNGMIRIMRIESLIYQILAMHIAQQDRDSRHLLPESSLLKNELKIVRQLAVKISKNVAQEYTLEKLTNETGLSQAKLQEGFKLLYVRTVTEYIRHVRLEAARDFIRTSELNISQIVYSVGFSSRSYFSKIFKNKYKISPSAFQNHIKKGLSLEEG